MSFKILRAETFSAEFKRLAKKHRSLVADYESFLESLQETALQGTEITPNIRKIRIAISSSF